MSMQPVSRGTLNAVLTLALYCLVPAGPAVAQQAILEYLFDAGATAPNSGSFSSADGFPTAGASFSSDTPTGAGRSLDLDGISGRVAIGDAFDYTQDGSFVPNSPRLTALTVEAWIKPDAATLSGQHVIWDDYGAPGVLFTVFDARVQFSLSTVGAPGSHSGPGISVFSPNPGTILAGQWQHVAGVYDGQSLRVFINGQDSCAVAQTEGGIQNNTEVFGSLPIAIGRDNVSDALHFGGLIDNVRLHDGALDRTQLAQGAFAAIPRIPCPGEDSDGDGVPDDDDVCPGFDDNSDQDGDLVPDGCDDCPEDANNDADGDGICVPDDNCPDVANADQSDIDGDNLGDDCDPDIDGDGVLNGPDNCDFDANADQADTDGDGAGDACDTDLDGDGVLDANDACVPTGAGEVVNVDGCSIADLVPCTHPNGDDKWKNHGAYVSTLTNVAAEFADDGLITADDVGEIVSAGAVSDCGAKNK